MDGHMIYANVSTAVRCGEGGALEVCVRELAPLCLRASLSNHFLRMHTQTPERTRVYARAELNTRKQKSRRANLCNRLIKSSLTLEESNFVSKFFIVAFFLTHFLWLWKSSGSSIKIASRKRNVFN